MMTIEKGKYNDNKLIEKEICKLIDDRLATWKRSFKDEKGDDKHVGVAVVKAKKSKDNYLDCLARVINVKDTCIAILFDGESLLISNNGKIHHARNYMKVLKEFVNNVNNPFEEDSYNSLVEMALEKIRHNSEKGQYPVKIEEILTGHSEKSNFYKLKSLLEKIKIYNKSKSIHDGDELYEIGKLFKEVFDEIKRLRKSDKSTEPPELWNNTCWQSYFSKGVDATSEIDSKDGDAKLIWDLLYPLYDVSILAKAICNGKIDERIIVAIKEEKIEYIEEGKGDSRTTHAEMKIIERICQKPFSFRNKNLYIGINKLTCAPCWITIDILNKVIFKQTLHVCGTHGGTYS